MTDEVDTVALPGDANRDGIFNSTDLILAFQAGEYEDRFAGNSVWPDGDWNGDSEFDSSDIVFAFQRSVYVLMTSSERSRPGGMNRQTLRPSKGSVDSVPPADVEQSRTITSECLQNSVQEPVFIE